MQFEKQTGSDAILERGGLGGTGLVSVVYNENINERIHETKAVK